MRVAELIVDEELKPADAVGWDRDRCEGFCGNVVFDSAQGARMKGKPFAGKGNGRIDVEVRRIGGLATLSHGRV